MADADPLAIAEEALRKIGGAIRIDESAFNPRYYRCGFCRSDIDTDPAQLIHEDGCPAAVARTALDRIQAAKEAQRG